MTTKKRNTINRLVAALSLLGMAVALGLSSFAISGNAWLLAALPLAASCVFAYSLGVALRTSR